MLITVGVAGTSWNAVETSSRAMFACVRRENI